MTDPRIDDDLADYMADPFEPTSAPFDFDREPPEIERQEEADRLLFLIRRAEDALARYEATAREQTRLISAWLEDRSRAPARVIEWASRSLENWARQMHQRTETVTWKLPHGTIKLNATHDRLVPTDEAAAVKALKARGMHFAVKTTETIRNAELKKVVTGRPDGTVADAHGEPIPGLEWVTAGPHNFDQKPPPDRHTPAADLDPPGNEGD